MCKFIETKVPYWARFGLRLLEFHRVSDFAIFRFFWMFGIFRVFLFFFGFFGPRRVPEGSGGAFGFIWTKFHPKWSHFGPVGAHFRFPIFRKPIRGPNSSQESLGSGPIWGPGPMEAEGRHYGGRRPTFWRGVGGRSPPTATQGVWGGKCQPPYCLGLIKPNMASKKYGGWPKLEIGPRKK